MDVFKFVKQFHGNLPKDNVRRIGRRYYLADDRLWDVKQSLDRDYFSIGLFLGEEKDRFYPSPALLEMISKDPLADRRIFVNRKAEWLFLCGRNVLESSIVKKNASDGLVLVQNERDENLGYGLFTKQGDELVIKNILDRGSYLRANERGRRRKK